MRNKYFCNFRNLFNFFATFTTFLQLFATFRDFSEMPTGTDNQNAPSEMPTGHDNQSAPSGKPENQEGHKRVSFDSAAKKHDGLCNTMDMFNEFIRDVFRTVKRPQDQTTVVILARNLNVLALFTLQKMLADLIWRCDRSRKGRAVILHKGGGCCGSINRQHIPWLVSHVEYLETVIVSVRTAIRRKEEQAEQALAAQDAN